MRINLQKYYEQISTGAMRKTEETQFLLLYLNIIREYFDLEFSVLKDKMKIKFDVNRIIDDLILLFFFLGNDFLPRCYCFDIREGNIEELIQKYKEHIVKADNYLNNFGIIDFVEMENLLKLMKDFEMKFIADRKNESDSELKRLQQEFEKDKQENEKKEVNKDNPEIAKNQKQLNMMKQENEFLRSLVEAMNNDTDAGHYKILYYQSKLQIDLKDEQKIVENLQKLDNIMQVYIEGLQFVGFYYYKGTPSWSWFYNNYYSPLASDLYEYVKQKNKKGQVEVSFHLDSPFPPIKQLLSIMHPANHRLLPESYRSLLTDPQSPLRQPIDYYPEKFDIDPYGGLYEHEYICILPFIESKLMNEVYEKLLGTLDEHSREKNQEGKSYRFRYDEKAEPILVKSTIGRLYNDFSASYTVEEFDIYQMARELETILLEEDIRIKYTYRRYSIPGDMQNKVLSVEQVDNFQRSLFPSLFSREIDEWKMEDIRTKKGKEKVQRRLTIKLKDEIPVLTKPYNLIDKKWRQAYIGYPSGVKCEIIGWIDKSDLCLKKDENPIFLSDYTKEYHEHIYEEFSDVEVFKKNGLEVMENQQIAFVRVYHDLRRKANGELIVNQSRFTEHYCPLQLLSSYLYVEPQPLYRELERLIAKQTPEQEFPINELVVILSSESEIKDQKLKKKIRKADGSLGKIKSIVPDQTNNNLFKVEVEVIQKITKQNLIKQLFDDKQEIKGQLSYFTIEFFASKLGISWKTLMYLLDSIEVSIDKTVPSGEKLTPLLDIGLNLINIRRNLLTPGFIRIFKADQDLSGYNKYRQLQNIEISDEVAQYISDFFELIYKSELIKLIDFNIREKQNQMKFSVNRSHLINISNIQHFIQVNEIWRNAEDPNIEALKVYMWLLKNPLSRPKLSGLASETYSLKKIQKIQESSNKDNSVTKQTSSQTILVDPNFLYKENRNIFIQTFYKEIPQYPNLGDRVVNLNTNGDSSIPIGAVGTVVGVLYNRFEVIFDKPFIGGENLGSRCDILRGAVVEMEDIFNLNPDSEWAQQLLERDPINKNLGWDGNIQHFVPNYKDEAIYDDIVFQQQQKLSKQKNIFELFNKWEDEKRGIRQQPVDTQILETKKDRRNSDHLSNTSNNPNLNEVNAEEQDSDYTKVQNLKKVQQKNKNQNQQVQNIDIYSGKNIHPNQQGKAFKKKEDSSLYIKVKNPSQQNTQENTQTKTPNQPQKLIENATQVITNISELEKEQYIELQRQLKYEKKKKKQSVDISQIQNQNVQDQIKEQQTKIKQEQQWTKKVKQTSDEYNEIQNQPKQTQSQIISVSDIENVQSTQPKKVSAISLEQLEANLKPVSSNEQQ